MASAFAALPAPLPLPPGTYALVGYGFDNDDPYGDGGNLPWTGSGVADAEFNPFAFVSDASPAYPSGGDGKGHASVSLRYQTPVPFVRILPMGDSITWGVGGTRAGYRLYLADKLAAAGFAFQYVGSFAENPATLGRDQQHHEGHPGWLIAADGASRDGLAGHLDAWLGKNGAALAKVAALHRARGEKVQLVDMHSAVAAGDFADALHPNDKGYQSMAQTWLEAIVHPQ
jgi:hypothetical protein